MRYKMRKLTSLLLGASVALPVSAKCGGVDYSWGADALALMHDYVVTMMLYVPKVLNKAECTATKTNNHYYKTNCLSMIYKKIRNYNLS